jgi:hypothetical protein
MSERMLTHPTQKILGIFEGNALGCHLCLEGAMFNHSCTPNAYTTYNETTREQTFHATRSISAGEEISISYLDCSSLLLSKPERQVLLQNRGFTCECEPCIDVEADEEHDVQSPAEELRMKAKLAIAKYSRKEGRRYKAFVSGERKESDRETLWALRTLALEIGKTVGQLSLYDLEMAEW